MTEQTQPTDAELYGDDCPGVRGDTRAPRFGEWMRGVWASARNPHRDGMFVRTVRRTGRLNPGAYHELTDGKGEFWSYPAKSTVFIAREASGGTPAGAGEPAGRVVSANCQYATVEWLQQTSEVGGGDPDNSRSWPITGDAVYLTPQPTQAQAGAVPLTVRLTSFPESNGKRNWTALLVRKEKWDGLVGNCGGISLARGELWNRVAYEAECARFLIGERDTEPFILDYGDDITTPDDWAGERGRKRHLKGADHA